MGPSIVYSERTNEELEELFRTIINDDEFLNVCQKEFHEREQIIEDNLSSYMFPTNTFDYEEIPTNSNDDPTQPRIVHEINMSIYYNVEVDKNNSDLTFVQRYINVLPEEKDDSMKKNRFSNLNLSNDIDRLIKIHDYVHHSQQQQQQEQEEPEPEQQQQTSEQYQKQEQQQQQQIPKQHQKQEQQQQQQKKQEHQEQQHQRKQQEGQQEKKIIENKKPSSKRRQTHFEPKRRTTVSTIDLTEKYDSVALAQIVEEQLAAARRAAKANKNFNPIVNQPMHAQPPVNRAKFVSPPELNTRSKEYIPRHRIDHIEYPKTNLNHLTRKPFTYLNNHTSSSVQSKEHEKLLKLGQQGIISSAVAFGTQRIPDNIKTIELLEIPNTKTNRNQYQDFHLIGYETLDNYSIPTTPVFRRTKSMRHNNNNNHHHHHKQHEMQTKRSSAIINEIPLDNLTKSSSPLKNIKHNTYHKNETSIHNKQVSKERSKGKTIRRN